MHIDIAANQPGDAVHNQILTGRESSASESIGSIPSTPPPDNDNEGDYHYRALSITNQFIILILILRGCVCLQKQVRQKHIVPRANC